MGISQRLKCNYFPLPFLIYMGHPNCLGQQEAAGENEARIAFDLLPSAQLLQTLGETVQPLIFIRVIVAQGLQSYLFQEDLIPLLGEDACRHMRDSAVYYYFLLIRHWLGLLC